jgi:Cu-Zn family superoxide dismutase
MLRTPVLLAALLITAGCSTGTPLPEYSSEPLRPQIDPGELDRLIPRPPDPQDTVTGTFRPWSPGATAITYDATVVPPGAVASVTFARSPSGFAVRLTVTGMIPRRSYGAHLHTSGCTAMPQQAGPHYQHTHDPGAGPSHPSVDPAYANPRNEIWLDFTADVLGAALVTESYPWRFGATPPESLIVHSDVTRTGKGVAGTAGARVACLSLTTDQPGRARPGEAVTSG